MSQELTLEEQVELKKQLQADWDAIQAFARERNVELKASLQYLEGGIIPHIVITRLPPAPPSQE